MGNSDEVRIHLDGPDGQIEMEALADAAKNLLTLITRPGSDARWFVSDLSLGSLELAVRPAGGMSEEDLSTVRELDEALTTFVRPRVPLLWDQRRGKALLELARLTSRSHVSRVSLTIGKHVHRVDARIERNVELSLSESPLGRSSLGSVRGVVKRYNGLIHEVGILDVVTGRPIKARYDERLTGRIVALIEHEVIAWGEIKRDEKTGRKTELHVHDVEEVGPPSPPAPVEEMIGIYGRDWTAGMSPEEWVRRQRD